MKPTLSKLLLVVAPLALALAAEMVVRLVVPGLARARGGRSAFLVNDEIAHEGEYERDPVLFWRMVKSGRVSGYVPGGVRTNALGLRGPDPTDPKPAGTLRVLGLGDSCTFGLGIARDEDVYGAVLARSLARDGRPVEWVNGGVSGYSSLQGRRLLDQLGARLAPDVVLLCFGLNDYLYAAGARDADLVLPPLLLLRCHDALRRSALVRLVERAAGGDAGPEHDVRVSGIPPRRVAPDELRANLASMVEGARALGARAVLLTLAVRPTIPLVLNPVYLPDGGGFRRVFGVWVAGQPAYRMTEWPGAEADLEAAIASCPELPLPHYFLGKRLAARGDARAPDELARARDLDRDRAVVAEYNAVIAAVARASGAMLFDQAALFASPESERFFDDERHLNVDGHRRLGEALAEACRKN